MRKLCQNLRTYLFLNNLSKVDNPADDSTFVTLTSGIVGGCTVGGGKLVDSMTSNEL